MTKRLISYKLNEDGSIPSFVEDGGYFPNNANDTTSMVCIGISKDDADLSDALQVFSSAEDAESYIKTYMSDIVFTDSFGQTKNFVIADEVLSLLNKTV